MVLPGHLAGGYLATTSILSLVTVPFSNTELTLLYIIGILAGEIPDIDLFAFYFEKNKGSSSSKKHTHREYITHLPLFWFSLCLVIFFIGYSADWVFLMTMSLVILAGVFSHFLFDSLDYGIQWFKPFSKRRLCLSNNLNTDDFDKKMSDRRIKIGSINFYWNYLKIFYLKQITFYAEVLVVIIAIFIFFKNF